jgi:hypothetical protein
MRRVLRGLLAAVLAVVMVLPIGCKQEGKPNPDLKVPDVPPSSRESKGGPGKEPAKKPPGR